MKKTPRHSGVLFSTDALLPRGLDSAPIVQRHRQSEGTMLRIAEAARQLGCHPDTLRNLERRRLIQPRRDWTGARRYAPEDLDRLRALMFPRKGDPADQPTR